MRHRIAQLKNGEARIEDGYNTPVEIGDQSAGNTDQDQIIQAQTLEGLDPLARDIAHDLNNVLQVVLGYSGLLLQHKNQGDQDYVDLQEIALAAGRGVDLVQRLLTLGKKVVPQVSHSNLNNEILKIQKLLSRTIPDTLDIALHLSGDLRSVQADQTQVRQILMNLWANARAVMPNGGTLTIETENIEFDEDYCQTHTGIKPGSYVLLTVSDTGQRMSKRFQAHNYEPTSGAQEVNRIAGMRLTTVHDIVRQHEGNMSCYRKPGHGTTLTICLPATRAVRDLETLSSETAIPDRTETIFVTP
jgi:two-component system cell cycle sensor histidine kinase/response regulator CckA